MAKKKYKGLWKTAGVLVVIGALNLGLGLFNFSAVEWFANLIKFGALESIVYGAVGISGLAYVLKALKLFK